MTRTVSGYDLVGVEQEVDEERLLLAATNRDRPTLVDDLQGTKDAGTPCRCLELTAGAGAIWVTNFFAGTPHTCRSPNWV